MNNLDRHPNFHYDASPQISRIKHNYTPHSVFLNRPFLILRKHRFYYKKGLQRFSAYSIQQFLFITEKASKNFMAQKNVKMYKLSTIWF